MIKLDPYIEAQKRIDNNSSLDVKLKCIASTIRRVAKNGESYEWYGYRLKHEIPNTDENLIIELSVQKR